MNHFFRVLLRTLDEPAARAFYSAVLGVPAERLHVLPLHEAAVARGARPHWIGFLQVPDVAAAAAAFTQRGATALAPIWVNPEGIEAAVMRDPGGAIVALAKGPPALAAAPAEEVAWFGLNTADVEAAKKNYGELAGWAFHAPVDLGAHGVIHPFSWVPGGNTIGSLADIASRPNVHPHWLFQFHVPALEPALAAVRKGGGLVADTVELPTGERIAVCDDPQGGAFSLVQKR